MFSVLFEHAPSPFLPLQMLWQSTQNIFIPEESSRAQYKQFHTFMRTSTDAKWT